MQKKPLVLTLSTGQASPHVEGLRVPGKSEEARIPEKRSLGGDEGRHQKVRREDGGERIISTSRRKCKPGGNGISEVLKEFKKHRGFYSAL